MSSSVQSILWALTGTWLTFAVYADPQAGLDALRAGDYDTAFRELSTEAEQGYPSAMIGLGQLYENGWGVELNGEQAAQWYREAALKGDARAMYNLGILYAKGHVVDKDLVQGVAWLGAAKDHEIREAGDPLSLLVPQLSGEQFEEAENLRREIEEMIYSRGDQEEQPEPLADPPVDSSNLLTDEQLAMLYAGATAEFEFRGDTVKEHYHPHRSIEKALAGKKAKVEGEYRDGFYSGKWWVKDGTICVDYAKIDEFDNCYWIERLSDDEVRAYNSKSGAAAMARVYRPD